MINIFDRTLKIIARNHAATFLRLAFPNKKTRLLGVVENVEISLPVRPVDFVHRILHEGEQKIFHLEFQLKHKSEIPQRTFITSAELTDLFNVEVLSVILYLKPREALIPTEYTTTLGDTVINRFSYQALKLWDYVEQIRNGQFRELAPLLPMLVKDPDEALLEEERALILQEPDDKKRAELLAAAVAIGSTYFSNTFLWQFFSEEVEQMKNVSFIQDWIEDGITKGKKIGITEGKKLGITEGKKLGITEGKKLGKKEGLTEGKKEGLTEGKKLGKKEGKLEMLCENITEALLTRFDPSARKLHPLQKQFSKLDDVPTLQQIYRHALTAQTFDQFAESAEEILEQKTDSSKPD